MLDELNAQLKPHGLRFAPDISTASRATRRRDDREQLQRRALGAVRQDDRSRPRAEGRALGRVARAFQAAAGRGARCRVRGRHARSRVLSDGAPARAADRRRSRRDASPKCSAASAATTSTSSSTRSKPFNLSKLIVGSEGTLALVLAAKINLVAAAEGQGGADGRVRAVARRARSHAADSAAQAVGDRDHGQVHSRSRARECRRSTRCGAAFWTAIPRRCCASSCTAIAPKICCRGWTRSRRASPNPACAARPGARVAMPDQARIWSMREAALGLSMAMKGDAKSLSFVEDTAVSPDKLRDYIDRFLKIVRSHGTVAGIYAHASVGCLHVRPVINMKTEEGIRRFEAIANDVADLVLEFGGALSGEHGDGLVRGPFIEKMFGPALYDAFRTVKKTFDPEGLFNPGQDRRLAAAHRQPSVRHRLPDARRRRRTSTTRSTAAWRAPWRCAAASAPAARRSKATCARRTWRRARKNTRRAAATPPAATSPPASRQDPYPAHPAQERTPDPSCGSGVIPMSVRHYTGAAYRNRTDDLFIRRSSRAEPGLPLRSSGLA